MKLFKTFAATAAVAAITMLSSCDDITEVTDEELADAEISKKQIELYNSWGKGPSGLDAVAGAGVLGSVDGVSGEVTYTNDSIIDFKAINSAGRSYITTKLTSKNGTKYAAVDSSEFKAVTKSIRRFKDKLKDIADNATDTDLMYAADAPFFVAKLGHDRGYCLANVTEIDTAWADSSAAHTGRVKVEYYYISADSLSKYSN